MLISIDWIRSQPSSIKMSDEPTSTSTNPLSKTVSWNSNLISCNELSFLNDDILLETLAATTICWTVGHFTGGTEETEGDHHRPMEGGSFVYFR